VWWTGGKERYYLSQDGKLMTVTLSSAYIVIDGLRAARNISRDYIVGCIVAYS